MRAPVGRFLLVVGGLLWATLQVEAGAPKGHLVIIGGGGTTPAIQRAMIDYAGGTNAVLLAITTAGGEEGGKGGESFVRTYSALGVARVRWAQPTRQQSDDPRYVEELLRGVTGIFFTGGKQRRIVQAHRGTLLHRRMLAMYEEGAVIGGTSAGAAMMSDPMITGARNDPKAKEPQPFEFKTIAKGMVETVEGMGFVKGIIVDQHFIKRSRENRLFSVALDHPQYTCVGIDEATAIVVSGGDRFTVVGKNSVMVIAPGARGVKTNAHGDYGARDLKVSLLVDGDTFQM